MVVANSKRRPAAKKTAGRPAPAPDATPGFQREAKTFPVEWTKGEWTGMWIRVRRMKYGAMLAGGVTLDWATTSTPRPEWLAGLRATSQALADVLDSWNVLDTDGAPVPATYDGLCSLDEDQAIAIVMGWAVQFLGVSVPLEQRSGSGATSPEASIPMETSSPNRES